MNLLDRVSKVWRKSWSGNPPIWELDAARFAVFGGGSYDAGREKIENDFTGYVLGAFKDNPIVFGCFDRRRQVFSQANFMWQRLKSGRPDVMYSTPDLNLLRRPWPNGTLPELLGRMDNDAGAAGNCYLTLADGKGRIGRAARRSADRRIVRMRPDWVTLVVDAPSGDPNGVDAQVVMLEYRTPRSQEPLQLLPDEYVHYSPLPDPLARFRGMSWLTPVIQEVMADKAATQHKLKFFENGAVHSMALKYPAGTSPDLIRKFKAIYDEEYKGLDHHYKTFHVAGADPIPMSANFQELDLSRTIGAGETRMAVASGVPVSILGSSEGNQGSTLNQGNFTAARRLFVDTTIRDLWSVAAPSLEVLFDVPDSGSRLWYDDRDIPFLREDATDDAEIKAKDAQTMRTLVDGGFQPDAVVRYVQTGDLGALKGNHTGLVPVQLQPPGTTSTPTNGQTPTPALALNGRARG